MTMLTIIQSAAEELGLPVLGRIPVDRSLVEGGDSGRPASRFDPGGAAGVALAALALEVVSAVPPADATCGVRLDQLLEALPPAGT